MPHCKLRTLAILVSACAFCSCKSPPPLETFKPPIPADNLLTVPMASNGCSWWDPLGVCDAGEQAVEDLLDAIPGITEDVKEAAMQVVDQLFNKIGDVMEKFETAVLRIEKQSVDDAKRLIALVEASIKSVTDEIVDKVEDLIGKSVAEITAACEAIIKDVSNLVNSIFSHITATLHDFEQFVWKTLCTGEGMIKQLELFVSASSMTKNRGDCECVHEAAVWAVDSCADSCTCKRGLLQPCKCSCGVSGWATVEDQNLYYAIRCKAMKEVETGIALNKTADWVAAKLGSIADLGYQLQCYHFSSAGTIGNWYANQALALTKAVNIWAPPKRASLRRLVAPSTTANAALAAQVKSLVATVQRQQQQIDTLHHSTQLSQSMQAMVAAGDCTTAFDCWTEALKRLETAEGLVNDALNKTRVAEDDWETPKLTFALNASVTSRLAATHSAIAANNQSIATNDKAIQANDKAIQANAKSESSLASKVKTNSDNIAKLQHDVETYGLFGGAYTQQFQGGGCNAATKCLATNPHTHACSCPTGFSPHRSGVCNNCDNDFYFADAVCLRK